MRRVTICRKVGAVMCVLRPVGEVDLPELVALYEQCADFLRLSYEGPIDAAYVAGDLALSRAEGGCFQGIYLPDGTLAGVLDHVPNNYQGNSGMAFLLLLLIAGPLRGQGLGAAVVRQVIAQARQDPAVRCLQSAVQVDNPRGVAFWERMGFVAIRPPQLQPDGTTTFRLEYRGGAHREDTGSV